MMATKQPVMGKPDVDNQKLVDQVRENLQAAQWGHRIYYPDRDANYVRNNNDALFRKGTDEYKYSGADTAQAYEMFTDDILKRPLVTHDDWIKRDDLDTFSLSGKAPERQIIFGQW